MSEITQMELINAQVEYKAKEGTTNKDITRNILKEWRGSEPIKIMEKAEKYYKVQNTEIDKKTRSYKDEAGKLVINDTLSNVKSKTAQYRKSVNQKLNFSLAKPFTISCEDDKYQKEWENFLTDEIRAVIKRTGADGINKGIGWSYPWINEKGILEIVDVEPETIYPAWRDNAHTQLDAIVRDFTITKYNNMTPIDERKVEYWNDKIVERYIDYSQGEDGTSGDLEVDTEDGKYELSEGIEERATIQQTHLHSADGNGVSWDKVPFLFFKGCNDELPLLSECISDIDNYDMVKSKAIDSILDDIDAVLIVEGISAEMGELARAREIVQNSRIVSIDLGGKAYFEKVNTDITSIAQELEIIRKDIQDNTSTVDLNTVKLGTNPSGETMKAYYEPLNEWCNGFETEFRVYMTNLKYFFDKWLSWRGGFGTFQELQSKKITFTLDRDMMINENDILTNIQKMNGLISQETLDEKNPWVENHEKEQKRRDTEEKEQQKKDELYNFNNDIDNNEEEDKIIDKTIDEIKE